MRCKQCNEHNLSLFLLSLSLSLSYVTRTVNFVIALGTEVLITLFRKSFIRSFGAAKDLQES